MNKPSSGAVMSSSSPKDELNSIEKCRSYEINQNKQKKSKLTGSSFPKKHHIHCASFGDLAYDYEKIW